MPNSGSARRSGCSRVVFGYRSACRVLNPQQCPARRCGFFIWGFRLDVAHEHPDQQVEQPVERAEVSLHRSGRPCHFREVRARGDHVIIAKQPAPPRVALGVNNAPLIKSAQRPLRTRNLARGLRNALRFLSLFHLALLPCYRAVTVLSEAAVTTKKHMNLSRFRLAPRARKSDMRSLAAEQMQFDLRLGRSLVSFLNGQDAATAFAWVPAEYARLVDHAGPINFEPTKMLPLDTREWKQPEFAALGLRAQVSAAVSFLSEHATLGHSKLWAVRDRVNEALETFQLVTVWRVNSRGQLEEVSVPRLDSVARCCAYVVGLMLLNRHDLRRGIKECGMKIPISKTGYMPHYFMDLPNSKRTYCCARHAATDRKRRERGASRRRKQS